MEPSNASLQSRLNGSNKPAAPGLPQALSAPLIVKTRARAAPSLVCEVIDTTYPCRLQDPAWEVVRELTQPASLPVVTLARDELRQLHQASADRPSNNGVGRMILREYPELAARYGAAEALGQTSYPTSRERYLYFLFLAVAGARAALYAKNL